MVKLVSDGKMDGMLPSATKGAISELPLLRLLYCEGKDIYVSISGGSVGWMNDRSQAV